MATNTTVITFSKIGFLAFIVATIVFFIKPFCDNCNNDIHISDKVIKMFLLFFFYTKILHILFSNGPERSLPTDMIKIPLHSYSICNLLQISC